MCSDGADAPTQATSIRIDVILPDGTSVGWATIQLVQGRAGTLSAVPLPVGTTFDTAPLWQTSDPTIVTVGAGLSSGVGYSVPFNVVGSSGTATITCQGRSNGVLVQATLAVTAIPAARQIRVSVAPNNTPPVGTAITATALIYPTGSGIIGQPQWSWAAPTYGPQGAVTLVPNADGTATITATTPGLVTISATASTPAGSITGSATIAIGVPLSDISLIVPPPMIQGQPAPGFSTLVLSAGSYFVIGQNGGSVSAVAVPIPSNAQVDAGSWSVSVANPAVVSAAINRFTGLLKVTAAADSGVTDLLVSASSGNGFVSHTTAVRVYVGMGPVKLQPLIAPILIPSSPGFALWFAGAQGGAQLTAAVTQAATAQGVVLTQSEIMNAVFVLEARGGLTVVSQAEINQMVAIQVAQRTAANLVTQGQIDAAIVDLQGNQLFEPPPPPP